MKAADDADLTGTTVDQYSIVQLIASGGQGRVYRGRDERLRRDVAIKVRRPPVTPQDARHRSLLAEARALSRLNHQHVAGIYDYLSRNGCEFIVMEFVAGATLRDVLAGGPLPPAEVIRLGLQMVRGLAAAHAANVLHHDVKPTNVKVTSSGELKILDFGVAALLPDGIAGEEVATAPTNDAVLAGTIPYMAPEQLRAEATDARTDIFSVGVVLYEMATGVAAFPQRSVAMIVEAILHHDPAPPSSVNPHVPRALEQVICRAMQKRPADRYQSAADLAAALEALTRAGVPAGYTDRIPCSTSTR